MFATIIFLIFLFINPVYPQDKPQKGVSRPQSRNNISTSSFWVSGYVASWTLHMGSGTNGNYGNMPYQAIDLDALTHVIMFAASINSDGSITYNNMVSSRRKPFNDYVHSKGKPILMSFGGAGNTALSTAIGATNRTALVTNLMNALRTEQYDGIDIDIEPVNASDTANIRLFVQQLYDSLQRGQAYYDSTKKPLLTAAVYNFQSLWARLSPYFDQINLMSYDYFGTWFGKSWHNNAPYGGSGDVDIFGAAMTTVQSKMQRYLDAGIPAGKFGVGADFNGYVWKGGLLADGSGNGITAPRQVWSSPPTKVLSNEVYGWKLHKDYIDTTAAGNKHFDDIAKAPYIGIDKPGNTEDLYITYQDTTTVKEIIRLAQSAGIGGVILWELGGGYFGATDFPSRTIRDPFLQAVKQEFFGASKIKGNLYFDQNSNGIMDPNEPGILGWVVQLEGTALGGPASDSAKTDSVGFYVFDDLLIGSYTVSLGQRPLWTQTFPVNPGTYSIAIDSNNSVVEAHFGVHSSSAFSFPVDKNWNIVSLPIKIPDNRISYVFPLADPRAYEYNNGYIERTILENGPGYWVKFPESQTVWISGQTIDADTIVVREGWNIVGSISSPIPVSTISSNPDSIIISNFSGYNGSYFVADTIVPGHGYWVKTNRSGTLILSRTSLSKPVPSHQNNVDLENLDYLSFTTAAGDARKIFFSSELQDQDISSWFELPPPPPQGVFDVRFSLDSPKPFGSMVYIISEENGKQSEVPIIIRSAIYPLKIAWQIKSGAMKYILDLGKNLILLISERGNTTIGPTQVENSQSTTSTIKLRIQNDGVLRAPSSFSLMQNYPNPFNNTTVITFNLPKESLVQLEVVNILGKRVASLLSQRMSSGTYTIPFETSNLPSGVYFYRLTAQNKDKTAFIQIKRMILLK